MVYIPIKNSKKTVIIFFAGIILLFTLFFLSYLNIIDDVVCQLVFLAEAVFYTFLLNKFVLPVYTYTLNSDNFTIVKTTGNKSVLECNIELNKVVEIVEFKKYKKQEKAEIKSVYNYCANIFAYSCYCLIFEYSNCRECVKFEPSDEMIDKMKILMCGLKENQ